MINRSGVGLGIRACAVGDLRFGVLGFALH